MIRGLARRVADGVRRVRGARGSTIHVQWMETPGAAEVLALHGQIVAVGVAAPYQGRPIPVMELLRLARVHSVTPLLRAEPCARCQAESAFRVRVEWESGYVSPDGDVVCEQCLIGPVTSGAELAGFPSTG